MSSSLLAKAVNNSFWTGIGSIGTAILGFLFAGVTIRWLGEAEAGFVIAVSTIIGINSSFSDLGLGAAATRLISKAHAENDSETIKQVAGICLSTSLCFGVFGLGIFSLGAPFIIEWTKYSGNPETGQWYCVLSGVVFLFIQIFSYLNNLLISLQRFDWETKLNLAFSLANGICGITLLKAFPSILTVGIVLVSLYTLRLLFTGFGVIRVIGFLPMPYWNKNIFLELWSFGKWVYMTQITVPLLQGIDRILIVSFFGSASLPFYAFAQNIYKIVHQTLVSQASYLFPMLSAQGNQLEEVAERTEERLRWFIGLMSSFIFSGLILVGPALLTIMVNAKFAKEASFQLFIFCWVGYIHAQAIVTFFFGLSKGDAKGNWIFHAIAGFAILPFMILFSITLGFRYAVLGNLAILLGVLYLCRRDKNKMPWQLFTIWFFKPLYASLILMCVSCLLHFVLTAEKANDIAQFVALGVFYILTGLSIPRIERTYLGGKHRIETLGRALEIVFAKLGLTGKVIFRLAGIPYESVNKERA